MIILYFIQIRHTDAFPPTGTLLVNIMSDPRLCLPVNVPIGISAYKGHFYNDHSISQNNSLTYI